MKNLKKITSILLAICLALSLCAFSVFAEEETTVAIVSYEYHGQPVSDPYTTLEEALEDSEENYTVYLVSNYILADNAEVPEGVTLVIPTGSALDDTTAGSNAQGVGTTGSAYVTLTVPTGKTLTVNGTLLVAGNQQSTQPESGCLSGDYGKIALEGEIVVEDGGKLYARGLITGNGTVTANSGSAVYQLFQIRDWRGGNGSYSAYTAGVFPFSRYEFTNIQSKATYYNGSTMYARYYIYASNVGKSGDIEIIGSNGLLQFDSTDAYVSTAYDSATGVLTATVNGAIKTGDIGLSFRFFFFDYTITSAGLVLPFGYNMDVVIAEDASLTVTDDMKLLPGCDITVEDGGALTVAGGATLFVYDQTAYQSAFSYNGNWTPSANATVTKSGTGTVSGAIGSSLSTLSNVLGGGVTYTDTTNVKEATQSGTSITVVNVPFYTYNY